MEIKKDLEELKKYVKSYMTRAYGEKNDYIKSMKTTKNGLFIYGHKVYAPAYSLTYKVHTYISWYEVNNYEFIQDLLDTFVLDCKRLKEAK